MIKRKVIYISPERLKELLQDPKFIRLASALGGKTYGGFYHGGGTIYQIKRGIDDQN